MQSGQPGADIESAGRQGNGVPGERAPLLDRHGLRPRDDGGSQCAGRSVL